MKVDLGIAESAIPKVFVQKPDGNYETFIDGFNVNIDLENQKIIKILATKNFSDRGEHISDEYKSLRSQIFYQWKNKQNAKIEFDEIKSPYTHSTKTWNYPAEYCRYPEFSSGNILIYLDNNKNRIFRMDLDAGQDTADCDNRTRAARDWFVGSRNGKIEILKLLYID